jgi:pSer/pThr/pTyr-binding forkhead associated (FHA) protein
VGLFVGIDLFVSLFQEFIMSVVSAELVPTGGGDAIPLEQAVITVGRRKSNDLCLDYPNVSGSHCEFYCEDGIWFVRDLGSSNGVKINGEKITSKKSLKPGDEVIIAKTHTFTIEYKLSADANAKLEEITEKEEDIFAVSLMEKAGLTKPKR